MTPHDLLANFEVLAEAPNGIQRLRELVLELAVRGKLVEQNAGDEPASELLRQIKEGKTKTRQAARGRATQSIPPVTPNEYPFQIPDSWVWTRALELGNVNPRNAGDDSDMVGFVPMAVLSTDYRAKIHPEVRLWKDIKKGYTHLADGDIAIAKITPCFENGKATVFAGLPGGYGAGTTELHILRPIPGSINPHFFLLFFKSPTFVSGGIATMTGTAGQQRVSGDYFKLRPVPLPPLVEQRRIVARVDELMALLDRLETKRQERETARAAARDSALSALRDAATPDDVEVEWLRVQERFNELFAIPSDVEPLRQGILQLAVRGRLLPQSDHDEPSPRAFESLRDGWVRLAKARKAGKPDPVIPVDAPERAFQQPASWEWVRFGDLFDCRLGKMLDKGKNHGIPRPYLRNANMRWGRFDLTDLLEMRIEESELGDVSVQKGDLVLCEGGEPGRCAVWESDDSIVIQKACHRARPMGGIDPTFYMLHIQADASSGRLAKFFTGATIKHLTGQSLAHYPVVLPPLAEQRRIVTLVSGLLYVLGRMTEGLSIQRCLADEFAAAAVHHLEV